MKYFPLHDRVLVRMDKNKETTDGGLFLPEALIDPKLNRPTTGQVIAVGEGITDFRGNFTPTSVKVGEKVFFRADTGCLVKELGEDMIVVPESDILCTLE